MADGWGGKREGAGRKPNVFAFYRMSNYDLDGLDCLTFLRDCVKDEQAPYGVRLRAAELLLHRVWGDKPLREVAAERERGADDDVNA